MAPPFSFFSRIETPEKKTMVVYLVRSLGLMPESVSHDWHVQPSCQRPNRGPPRRCEFSPGDLAARAKPTVLETLQTYRRGVNPVNRRSPQNFQWISTMGKHPWSEGGRAASESRFLTIKPLGMTRLWVGISESGARARNSMAFRTEQKRQFRRAFCAPRYGRQEIETRTPAWRSLV